MKSVVVTLDEKVILELFRKAIVARVARDYDMLDDIRSNAEILQDLLRRATSGEGDLLRYIQEMVDGNTQDLYNIYKVHIP